jgi:hypothetical protein
MSSVVSGRSSNRSSPRTPTGVTPPPTLDGAERRRPKSMSSRLTTSDSRYVEPVQMALGVTFLVCSFKEPRGCLHQSRPSPRVFPAA